jgi:hypothetical protein
MTNVIDYKQPSNDSTPARKRGAMFWTGWVLTVLVALFLAMGGVMNVSRAQMAAEGLTRYGYPPGVLVPLGVVVLVCVALYLIPRTAVLGAILLTGYLGGAVATHVRVGHPLFSHTLFPVYLGALLWGGLCLRDARLRALLPLRRGAVAR